MPLDKYGPVQGRCRAGYRKHKTSKMCINKDIPRTPTPQQYGPVPGRCRAGYKKNKTTKLCIKKSLQSTMKASEKPKSSNKSTRRTQTIRASKPITKKFVLKKQTDTSIMNVYIASMNMRGEWAKAPNNCKKINVTSAQQKASRYRIDFSPMTHIPGGYKGFYCFENYWQAGKRYQGIEDIEKQIEWWKKQTKGRRRYPGGKGKKILYAEYPGIGPLDYIPSRKQVYVPEYYDLIKDKMILKDLQKRASKGECLVIYDFDGPRNQDRTPTVKKVTLELLKEKLNDGRFPFGHGYIVAGAVAGILPEEYLD
jgi:hypothetical protein